VWSSSNCVWVSFPRARLPVPSVVGLLDPGDDREPQFGPGGPPLPIQDVALQ